MSSNELVIEEELNRGIVIGVKETDGGLYLKSFGDIQGYELMGFAEAIRIIANNSLQEIVGQGSFVGVKELRQTIQGVLSLLVRVNQFFSKLTKQEGNKDNDENPELSNKKRV